MDTLTVMMILASCYVGTFALFALVVFLNRWSEKRRWRNRRNWSTRL